MTTPLSNIYNYLPSLTGTSGPTQRSEGGWDMPTQTPDGWTMVPGIGDNNSTWQYTPPDNLRGVINGVSKIEGGSEGQGGGYKFDTNFRALPNSGMTSYGPVEGTMPTDPSQRGLLRNPNMSYNDPNYGYITPQSNLKPDSSFAGRLSYLVPGLAMAGLGNVSGMFAGAGTLGKAGIGAAKMIGGRLIQDATSRKYTPISQMPNSWQHGIQDSRKSQKYTGPMPPTVSNNISKPSGGTKYTGPMPTQPHQGS